MVIDMVDTEMQLANTCCFVKNTTSAKPLHLEGGNCASLNYPSLELCHVMFKEPQDGTCGALRLQKFVLLDLFGHALEK